MARDAAMPAASQQEIPIQPVEKPILCNPFTEPTAHWHYDRKTGVPSKRDWRRPASYWFKTERTGAAQMELLTPEESEDLPLVNALRDDVRQWRKSKYENATQVTKQLLAHWWRTDRARRLFFCQLEAVETVIYLTEILASGKKPRWKPALSVEDFEALRRGERPANLNLPEKQTIFPTLIDKPNEQDLAPLIRYGCKMATGSGKTVVMIVGRIMGLLSATAPLHPQDGGLNRRPVPYHPAPGQAAKRDFPGLAPILQGAWADGHAPEHFGSVNKARRRWRCRQLVGRVGISVNVITLHYPKLRGIA
jgi:hypothetical protein